MKHSLPAVLVVALILGGCATTNQHVLDSGDQTQLQKRSYESRTFDTADKEKVMRATISTLQDLGFVIDRADLVLGSVSATKLDGTNQIKITVFVRPKGTDRMVVRANAQFNVSPVVDPKQYQDFFTSLGKSLFLSANTGE
jgi:PBP1b-binding outer membrane lipoprotein LpoB